MRVKTLIPSILFDYNQRLSNNFSILVGAGIGFMFPLGGDEAFLEGSSASEMLNIYPRIGIELYDRLRFTAEYRIALIESGYAAITLGYVFGGRPK